MSLHLPIRDQRSINAFPMSRDVKTLSLAEIQELIPHRAPFLWLDEVTELSESRIVATKYLPDGLDVFRGHYPSFPVLPGVLQCEAAFQAGAVLIAARSRESASPQSRAQSPEPAGRVVPVVTRLGNVQFRRMVRPGETLTLEVEIIERLANAWFLKGKVSVDGQVTLRLEFACAEAAAG